MIDYASLKSLGNLGISGKQDTKIENGQLNVDKYKNIKEIVTGPTSSNLAHTNE